MSSKEYVSRTDLIGDDDDEDSFHSATDGSDIEPESEKAKICGVTKKHAEESLEEEDDGLAGMDSKSPDVESPMTSKTSSSSLNSGSEISGVELGPQKSSSKSITAGNSEAARGSSKASSSSKSTDSPRSYYNDEEEDEGFENLKTGRAKSSDFFKVPAAPALQASKKSAAKKENDSNSTSNDDDWFKAQMDEFGSSAKQEKNKEKSEFSEVKTEDKSMHKRTASGGRSIWDWTGIQEVVSAVGEGLSNVVESGLGLPNPEHMAKLSVAEHESLGGPEASLARLKAKRNRHHQQTASVGSYNSDEEFSAPTSQTADAQKRLPAKLEAGGLFSGAGLFSGLVSGGLDVLESLGKKTFETLTIKNENDGDRRRFFLNPDSSTQNLSELLKDLRESRDQEIASSQGAPGRTDDHRPSHFMGYGSTTVERFNTNFVSLFEKSEGMVHLEGLEILSKDQEKRTKHCANSPYFEEKLLEFCVEDVSECSTEDFAHEIEKSVHFISLPYKPDSVLEMNKTLTQELSLRQAAVDADEEIVVDAIHEAAITALAKLTAHSIQALHKLAQLIVIAKDLPEIDSLFAFTYLLCRRLSFFASQYANILSLVEQSNKVDEVVTNIFFECSNACHYLKKALELLRPFFRKQI
ncbi:protein FAM [Ditylenchus destructor]|uniref:Protein FAM n=1 Tax=Ditylenchus destructor TaxID=166010 RepID=A0AAD4RBD0_9BILA|nr:protein FAM [Ditylenchus destructor]